MKRTYIYFKIVHDKLITNEINVLLVIYEFLMMVDG